MAADRRAACLTAASTVPSSNKMGSGGSEAVLEAPALVAGLDDVAVVGEAVEQGGGHLGVAEYFMMPPIEIVWCTIPIASR